MENTMVYRNLIARLGADPDWPEIRHHLGVEWVRLGQQWKDPLARDVNDAFTWSRTTYGSNYWHPIFRRYSNGGVYTAPQPKPEKKYAAIYS